MGWGWCCTHRWVWYTQSSEPCLQPPLLERQRPRLRGTALHLLLPAAGSVLTLSPGWWQMAQSPGQSSLLWGPITSKADLTPGFGGCLRERHRYLLNGASACLSNTWSQLQARPLRGGSSEARRTGAGPHCPNPAEHSQKASLASTSHLSNGVSYPWRSGSCTWR